MKRRKLWNTVLLVAVISLALPHVGLNLRAGDRHLFAFNGGTLPSPVLIALQIVAWQLLLAVLVANLRSRSSK